MPRSNRRIRRRRYRSRMDRTKRQRHKIHHRLCGIVLAPLIRAGGRAVPWEVLRHQTSLGDDILREVLYDLKQRGVVSPVDITNTPSRQSQHFRWNGISLVRTPREARMGQVHY